MFFTALQRSLRRRIASTPPRPPRKRNRFDTHLPRLEALEERCLLSTLTVLNTSDGGPGSLRQAILDANGTPGADTINFNIAGSGVQAIAPASPLPTITEAVT